MVLVEFPELTLRVTDATRLSRHESAQLEKFADSVTIGSVMVPDKSR